MSLSIRHRFDHFINRHPGKLLLIGLPRLRAHIYGQWRAAYAQMAHQHAQIPPRKQWPEQPVVSLVVAAWNEAETIADFLDSFADLTYPHKELILVAGGDDGTLQQARKRASAQVTVLEQPAGEGKFRALQRGLQHAHGRVIFLTDADCRLNSESFLRVIYPVAAKTERAVTGLVRPLAAQLRNPFVRAQATKRLSDLLQSRDPYVPYLMGANSALDRTLLEEFWAGAPNQPIGEDYYLALSIQRAGHKILQVGDSYIETRFPETVWGYIQQKSRWHRSYLALHRQFGDKRWINNVLSSIKYQLLLAMPLLLFLPGRIGRTIGLSVWLLSWALFCAPYMEAKTLTSFCCETRQHSGIGPRTVRKPHHFVAQSRNASCGTRVSPQELTKPADAGQETTFFALSQLMIADFCAWAIVLPQLITGEWRERW